LTTFKSNQKKRKHPDFLLVGAMKTGTTSIYNVLKKHPNVFCSPIKEPNYYCTDISELVKVKDNQWHILPIETEHELSKAIKKGSICEHVINKKIYSSLFENAEPNQTAGEFSVAYMPSTTAAIEISKDCPDARIIMVLRCPIERALSDFSMCLMLGLERGTFSNMIAENINLDNPSRYLSYGLYYEQVKRYLDVFSREQVLILQQEELKSNFLETMEKIYRHIGVEIPEKENIRNPKSFERTEARAPFINSLMYKTGLKRLISKLIPRSFVNYGKSLFYKKSSSVSQIDKRDRELLVRFYKKDVELLSALIDQDLLNWLSLEKK